MLNTNQNPNTETAARADAETGTAVENGRTAEYRCRRLLRAFAAAVILVLAAAGHGLAAQPAVRSVEELVSPPVPGAGSILAVADAREYTTAELAESIPNFFEYYESPAPLFPVRSWQIEYASTDFDGSPATIRARIFAPVLDEPEELPVYVFASGTTGIGDECAPCFEEPEVRRWGWYTQNMLAYASQGFIVVFPEYTGFHDPAVPQRYFSKYAEGYMMLDAIRACFGFFSHPSAADLAAYPGDAVFTSGYSQGGHAAMAAADLRPYYAPELPLAGIITYGSTNDVEALLREGVAYTPLILHSYRAMYGAGSIRIEDCLLPRWVENFDAESILCVDEFQVLYGFDAAAVYTDAFRSALDNRTLERDFPELWRLAAENHTGHSGHGVPALVIQGGLDFIVTEATQTRFVLALRELGSATRYLIFPRASHRYTRHAGFGASIDWMREQAGQ